MSFYKINPDNYENSEELLNFADIIENLVKENKTAKAIELLQSRLENGETFPIYYSLLAKIYEKMNLIHDAVETYQNGLQKHPGDSYLLIGLGFVYYTNKDYREAERTLTKAWVEDPVNVRLLTVLGNINKKKKKFKKASKYYKIANLLEPNNTFAIYGIANCYRGMGHFAEELEFWLKFYEFEPNNKIALTRIGDCYYKLKQMDQALIYYEKALDINYDFYALLGKARIYQEKDEYEKALHIYEELSDSDKDNVRYFNEYIKFLLKFKKMDKARKIYNRAVKLFPGNNYITSLKEHF
ncbi:MAG TPA: tetratricopeptide repeat protein [Spirochaetota bacterium]|nr:tetratricopeptide repeat protein [Spirochaetota bacterium]